MLRGVDMSIGELTAHTGVPVKTIRYYSGLGLVPEAGRTAASVVEELVALFAQAASQPPMVPGYEWFIEAQRAHPRQTGDAAG